MFQKSIRLFALAYLALLVGLVGCQDQTTASSAPDQLGEVAASGQPGAAEDGDFRAVMAGIEAQKTKICQAFADGTPEEAHDALHNVGHSLEKLPALATQDGKLSTEQLAIVNNAVEALFDGFGKLDDTLHGGEEVDVKALEEKLTLAINELKGVMQ